MLQGGINPRQGHLFPEFLEAGDAKIGDAARHDAAKMRQVGRDIERESVKRDPTLHAHSEGADLGFVGAFADPDTDPSGRAVRRNAEFREGIDHPAFERMDEAADVLPALLEVEHDVADPLTGAVIGVAATAPRIEDRKLLGVHELRRVCAGTGSEQRGMLEQPDALARRSFTDGGDALLHEGERLLIRDWSVADFPFDFARNVPHGEPDGCAEPSGQALRRADGARISGGGYIGGRVSMRQLSISAAWEETRAILSRDGGLLMTVALALIALPSLVSGLLNPNGLSASTAGWITLIEFLASVIALAGQLALIRLAIGPSITVGAAILHGLRRVPIYFVAVLLLGFALFLLAIPIVVVLGALGVPLDAKPIPMTMPVVVASLLLIALVIFFAVRLLISSPVASAEDVGPIAILTRSWRLTAGHWWALFGFLLIFIVGALVLLIAIGAAVGSVVALLIGKPEPMSAAALVIGLVQALVSAGVTTIFAVMLARIYLQLSGSDGAQASVPRSGI